MTNAPTTTPTPKPPRPTREELESAIDYKFQNPDLLSQALTHRSFVHESKDVAIRSYERLEFLGDAVLELAISYYLWTTYPELPEGDLTRMRAELVKKMTLAHVANRLQLGPHLRLGRGERLRGGAQRASILADTVESVLGAVFLDGGFPAAQQVCLHILAPELDQLDPNNLPNYKNRLQELAASMRLPMPRYQLLHVEGPEHQPTFVMEAQIPTKVRAQGHGTNKKTATQEAARELLRQLKKLHLQADQPDQVNLTDQIEQVDRVEQLDQVDQADQTDQATQIAQVDQIDQDSTVGSESPLMVENPEQSSPKPGSQSVLLDPMVTHTQEDT